VREIPKLISNGKEIPLMKNAMKLLLIFSMILSACGKAPVREEGLANGEHTADLNGFSIFYAVHGKGPVLMAVPNSWGLSHEGIRSLYRPLEEHLTMVYFDPRGMGRSGDVREDADMSMAAVRADLEALRLHLGLDKVNLIGWSNGGMNLLLFAAEHPDALSSLILVHTIAHWGEEDLRYFTEHHPEFVARYNDFMATMAGGGLSDREKEEKYREFTTDVSFPAMLADPAAGKPGLEEFFGNSELSWKHSLYSDSIDSPAFDAREHLGKITAPTLVIAGAHDLLPATRCEEVAQGIPGSRYVLFEKSGHFSPFEEREKFVKTVTDFLSLR
jgi:proline iminopeptidase